MTEWREVKLGDVCDVKGGKRLPKGSSLTTIKNNHPYIRVRDLGQNKILQLNQDYEYVDDETQKTISRYTVSQNDVLISIVGTIGLIGIVGRSLDKSNLTENCVKLINLKEIDKDFLYYYLISKRGQDEIKQGTVGAVQAKLPLKNIQSIKISLPPLGVQRKIAGVLGALDDKIELNNKINQNLELQAQALFKSWFVDFEPFGGKMPDDWKNGKVDDIIELFDSQRIPLSGNQRENMQKIYPYYGATSLMDYVDNYIFDGKYLLLGEDGTVIDDKGFPVLQYIWGKFWVNNHAHILRGKNGFNVESLYLFFKQTNIKSIVTGAVQPKVNQANLRALPAIIPNLDIMKKFNETIEPLFSLIRNNRDENTRLEKLRDTLLPKLMSGEIDVSNVDISELPSADKLSFNEVQQ